jgi:anti-anti-sigma factor
MTMATVKTSAESGSIRIRLSGEIDLANVAAVEEEILAAVPDQPTAVSVDLTDLTYIDSAGIRILSIWQLSYKRCGSCWNSSCRLTRPPAD